MVHGDGIIVVNWMLAMLKTVGQKSFGVAVLVIATLVFVVVCLQ